MPCSLFSDLSIHKCILLMIQKNISTTVREETSALVAPSIYTLTWRPDLLPCSWSGKYTQVPVCVSIYPTLLLRAKEKRKNDRRNTKERLSSLFLLSVYLLCSSTWRENVAQVCRELCTTACLNYPLTYPASFTLSQIHFSKNKQKTAPMASS